MLQVDDILGEQPELKEKVFTVLKQYAAERKVECLASALCMVLTQESHQQLIDSIRYRLPGAPVLLHWWLTPGGLPVGDKQHGAAALTARGMGAPPAARPSPSLQGAVPTESPAAPATRDVAHFSGCHFKLGAEWLVVIQEPGQKINQALQLESCRWLRLRVGLGLPRGERCLQGLRLCVLAVLSSGSPAPLFSLQNSRGWVCSHRSCCAALVTAKWRGMGTGLVPVRGHVVGITARLRRWPLGNQVSIWPRSGSGFPIPALISGIARYYSYHNNGPVLGSHHACRGPVEGRVGGAGGCHGPQCSLLPRALS